jgi:hypothetical protein
VPIIIQSGSPFFTEPEDLQALANALRSQSDETEVVVHTPRDQRGYSVTPWEVVYIWLTTDPTGTLVGKALLTGSVGGIAGKASGWVSGWVVDAVKDWVKSRIDLSRKEHEARKLETPKIWSTVRPTAAIILGPDGKELLTIEQQGNDPEPREVVDKENLRQMPPPTV